MHIPASLFQCTASIHSCAVQWHILITWTRIGKKSYVTTVLCMHGQEMWSKSVFQRSVIKVFKRVLIKTCCVFIDHKLLPIWTDLKHPYHYLCTFSLSDAKFWTMHQRQIILISMQHLLSSKTGLCPKRSFKIKLAAYRYPGYRYDICVVH